MHDFKCTLFYVLEELVVWDAWPARGRQTLSLEAAQLRRWKLRCNSEQKWQQPPAHTGE